MKRLFFLLALSVQAAFGQSCLVTDSLYAVGNGPYSIKYADLNGDYLNDMIVSFPTQNKLKFYLNLGTGTFGSATSLNTGTGPSNFVVMDLNGDYVNDIVVANTGSNDLSLFTNNGFGNFTSSTYALGYSPWSIAAADFDGDWDYDLAISNAGNTQFTTYLVNVGNLSVGATSSAAYRINSLAAADVDWDGQGDVVTANASTNGTNAVSFFKGNGGGAFQPAVNINATAGNATDIVLADFNGDYYSDIAISTFNYTIETFIQTFNGFNPGYVYNSSPNRLRTLAALDLDGDYKNEIAFSDSSNGSIAFLVNDGMGNFNSKVYPSPMTGSDMVTDITSGDVNGDYVTDAGAVMTGKNKAAVILNFNTTIYYTFNSPVCQNDAPFQLDAWPQGGTFYVNGAMQNMFDPMVYGPGTHTIVYNYNPPSGCPVWDTTYIVVLPSNGQAVYNENVKLACVSSPPFQLTPGSPAGGTYTGPGVTGSTFDPAAAGLGQHIITYTIGNCGGGDTSLITVVTSPVNVVLVLNPPSACLSTPAFTLAGGVPAGGTYSGPGVSNGVFNPAAAGVGNHLISYSFTDPNSGCTDYELASMYVSPCLASIEEMDARTNLHVLWKNDDNQLNISAIQQIDNVEVYDVNGKLITRERVSDFAHTVQLGNIDRGIYFVKVYYADQTGQVKKFAKL